MVLLSLLHFTDSTQSVRPIGFLTGGGVDDVAAYINYNDGKDLEAFIRSKTGRGWSPPLIGLDWKCNIIGDYNPMLLPGPYISCNPSPIGNVPPVYPYYKLISYWAIYSVGLAVCDCLTVPRLQCRIVCYLWWMCCFSHGEARCWTPSRSCHCAAPVSAWTSSVANDLQNSVWWMMKAEGRLTCPNVTSSVSHLLCSPSRTSRILTFRKIHSRNW